MSALARDRRHKDGALPLRISPNRHANSLFHNVLPVTALFSILCTGNASYLHENKYSRGEGVPRAVRPDWSGRLAYHGCAMNTSTIIGRSSSLRLAVHVFCALTIAFVLVANIYAQVDANASAPAVTVDADGTVHIPPQVVPLSSFLSPEARAYVTYRLLHPDPAPNPDIAKERARIDAHLAPLIDKQKARYPVDMQAATIGGVPTLVIVPKAGIAPRNQHRVLINLHGGGFSVCAPTCGIIESIPIAGLGKIKVVTVNYRQGPEFKFPAASEDVAKVYAELLKQYKPESIGIFGCSAGGMLTAESVAWIQTHHLPRPGAIGIFCASAGDFGGDAQFTTPPLDGRMPPPPKAGDGRMHLGYFSEANMRDPMISPAESAEVLRQFPPTLILSGTRAFDYSSGINTHNQLTKLGVEAELHLWDGLFHGFFYDPDVPESRETYDVTVKFFDKHLQP
jgi:monoterpene epsilon-lactone hydrolase